MFMSPSIILKILLPTKLKWVKEVVDVEYEGEVSRYMGQTSSPSDTWEEYIIFIKIVFIKMKFIYKYFPIFFK